jgi:hypothetical protein
MLAEELWVALQQVKAYFAVLAVLSSWSLRSDVAWVSGGVKLQEKEQDMCEMLTEGLRHAERLLTRRETVT